MSEMLKCWPFFANVFWCYISPKKLFLQRLHRQPNLYDYSCEKDSWSIEISKVWKIFQEKQESQNMF